ncbi:30S ribosomal protein S20 [Thermodesulfobacteriota bacterium]
MANHKSALKRAKQNEVKRIRNLSYKTRVKNVVKELRTSIADKSEDKAKENLREVTSIAQKSVSKGAIHKKKASRKISRLALQVNRIASS